MSVKSFLLEEFIKSFLRDIRTFFKNSEEVVIFVVPEKTLIKRLQEKGKVLVTHEENKSTSMDPFIETDFILQKEGFSDMILIRSFTDAPSSKQAENKIKDAHVAIRQKMQSILTSNLNVLV